MKKVAVVGLGMMGKLHARVWTELGYKPAICDIDHEATGIVSDRGHCTIEFDNIDELLSKYQPDIVSIAVPTLYHREVASKCLKAGADILLEKPISMREDIAYDLVSLARDLNRVFAVGYIETFNPAFIAVKQMFDQGRFGEVTSINIKRVGGIPRSADNVILDLMTHDIGLLINLFGTCPHKLSVKRRFNKEDNIVDSAQSLLWFGEVAASCETNWISPVKIRTMDVTGTKGCCEANLINQTFTWYGKEALKIFPNFNDVVEERHIYQFRKEPLKEELSNFIKYIDSDRRYPNLIVSGEQGLEILSTTLDLVNFED